MKGYVQTISEGKIKRYVQYLEISDDPELIELYCKYHSEAHHWKEIRDGIRQVGILEMELYRIGNHLVMIVDAPADFDWEESMNRLAILPRQAEWEAFVSKFQGCDANAKSTDKWQPMERIFKLYD